MLSIFKPKETKEQKQLSELRKEFRAAIERDNTMERDRIYKEMLALEEEQDKEAQEQKSLQTISNDIKRDHIKNKIEEFCKIVDERYEPQVKEVMDRINIAKQNYIESLKPLNELNIAYEKEVNRHYDLMRKYELGRAHNKDEKESVSMTAYGKLRYGNMITSHPRMMQITSKDINKQIQYRD